jgi:HSP20 family protein
MSVMRFDPFGDPFRQMDRLTNQLMSGTRTPMGMPMDVWQADDGYHVALDLPGIDPGSVDITCERNMLTIRAERRAEYEQAQSVVVAERPQGSFTRQLQIGEALDTGKVRASYDNGVLHLLIPVAEAAQPRRIEVQRGGGERSVDLTGQQERAEVGSGTSS